MEGIDAEMFAKGPAAAENDLAMITTPYEPHDISGKTSRRRHTQPAVHLNDHRKHFREKRLRQAATFNDVDKLNYLLKDEGIDPNAADEQGRTSLHIAASRGYEKIVLALIKSGANPNLEDKLGNTPLHLAVYTGSVETVTYLLEGGCRIRRTAALPYTPLELARSKYVMLEKQKSCEQASTQTFRIMWAMRKQRQLDLINQFTSEETKLKVDSLLKSVADIEISDPPPSLDEMDEQLGC